MSNILSGREHRPVGLLVGEARAAEIKQEATSLRSLDLNDRQICDLELMLSGAYAPLAGFMSRADYESVLQGQRLTNGEFFPLPITLDLPQATAQTLKPGERAVLRDDEGAILAVLEVEDIWAPDRRRESDILYPSSGSEPGRPPLESPESYAVGGRLEGVSLPIHHDYPDLRIPARRLRDELMPAGQGRVIAIDPTTNLPSGCHRALASIARELDALVLLQPAIGAVRPTDLGLHRCIKQYRAALTHYPGGRARLALLPLVRRGLGTRELLWRAIVNRNSGVTHFCVDPRDYGLGTGDAGSATVRKVAAEHAADIGLELLSVFDLQIPTDEFEGANRAAASAKGSTRGEGDTASRGVTCFFTGLSGAGKSTVARALAARVADLGRTVTLLDGDLIRRHLSSELTFSKEHRDLNIRRIGYVASEITRHGGIAICAPIAPYRVTRAAVRAMIEEVGDFLEIHVATPIAVCAERDPKGLYAKAHAGLIKNFTGINDPYEIPEHPEISIDTSKLSVEEAVSVILQELARRGRLDTRDQESQRSRPGMRSSGSGTPGHRD